MQSPAKLAGLYAITDDTLDTPALLTKTEAILRGGARAVQYRDKRGRADKAAIASELLSLCRAFQALLIINDDVELARSVGAHGVHIGRDDAALKSARSTLGAQALIGVSCYNELARARQAVGGGADYIAFGSFFESPTKPGAVRAAPGLLGEARDLGVAVVAIGGITPDNGAALVSAGADALAVISGVYQAGDPQQAATRYARLFE